MESDCYTFSLLIKEVIIQCLISFVFSSLDWITVNDDSTPWLSNSILDEFMNFQPLPLGVRFVLFTSSFVISCACNLNTSCDIFHLKDWTTICTKWFNLNHSLIFSFFTGSFSFNIVWKSFCYERKTNGKNKICANGLIDL